MMHRTVEPYHDTARDVFERAEWEARSVLFEHTGANANAHAHAVAAVAAAAAA